MRVAGRGGARAAGGGGGEPAVSEGLALFLRM